MKKIHFLLIGILFFATAQSQSVGIGTTNPNGKAILDVSSNSKGFLPPRMTAAERIAINPANPARGLMVFDTDSIALMVWNGSAWQKLAAAASGGTAWLTTGNNVGAGALLGNLNYDTLTIISKAKPVFRSYYAHFSGFHSPNTILGSDSNRITGTSYGSSILGGGLGTAGRNTINNAQTGTIAGGLDNKIDNAASSFIGGGQDNLIDNSGTGEGYASGIVSGHGNYIRNGTHSIIGGGLRDTIRSPQAAILGGYFNKIDLSSEFSFIGSGQSNLLSGGSHSAIVAGINNKIYSDSSFIGGGAQNQITANSRLSVITGGYRNYTNGLTSFIGGGQFDSSFASFTVISGGNGNTINSTGYGGTIGGGSNNTVNASHAAIGGGFGNINNGQESVIAGGLYDTIGVAQQAFIGGGNANRIYNGADGAVIAGGIKNYIGPSQIASFIGSGTGNIIGANYAAVVGGKNNFAEGLYSIVGGGHSNRLIYGSHYGAMLGGQDNYLDGSTYGSIVGGRLNYISFAEKAAIVGGYKNYIGDNSTSSFIGGGDSNRVELGIYSVIAGGYQNKISGTSNAGAIGGGKGNRIEKQYSVIGGGLNNWSRGDYSAVLGGNTNEAGGNYSVVSGGAGNSTQADYSTVIGGRLNEAWANYSVAGGFRSKILHSSNFLYADFRGSGADFNSRNNNQFMVRTASGALFTDEDTSTTIRAQMHVRSNGSTPQLMVDQVGNDFARIRFNSNLATSNHWDLAVSTTSSTFNIFKNSTGNILQLTPLDPTNLMMMSNGARLTIGGTWTNASDRNVKNNITTVNENEILARLVAMPVTQWHYKAEAENVYHIGPMAQDFAAAFGLGDSNKSIATVDADGINMAAIKALYNQLKQAQREIENLKKEVRKLKK